MTSPVTVVIFHNDLRLHDHPALFHASKDPLPVIPLFVHSKSPNALTPGAASRSWLHRSLAELDLALREMHSRLIVAKGETVAALEQIHRTHPIRAVYWHRRWDPEGRKCDAALESALINKGIRASCLSDDYLLFLPDQIRTQAQTPFKVFTPFWQKCLSREVEPPLPDIRSLTAPSQWPVSLTLEELNLTPKIPWDSGFYKSASPGCRAVRKMIAVLMVERLISYTDNRDHPDCAGTSRLSPHLHFGEISIRELWHLTLTAENKSASKKARAALAAWRRQLIWREFSWHLLYHFPDLLSKPLRPEFQNFPWEVSALKFRTWCTGKTGYPIVDAGMRELWATGWMHNRVRMIAASFLVKDLMIDWREGAKWFLDTLVDADLGNNTSGWQWVAGCGADAAPYFRIFNPVLQSAKFDSEGEYIRRWIPELRSVPTKYIHAPWTAPPEVLDGAGIRLGREYPQPVVDHALARRKALLAYDRLRP